jgi:NAD(P)-dependent dehydrogenase (short-subunit alcohol dehydrogenase family)
MDTFAGVQSFVADLKRDVEILDIVLLNAGVTAFSYQELAGGWESDLQVNTLSTTLLTLLLIPYMRNVGAQHLAIVGSSTHIKSNVSNFPETGILDFLNDKKNFKDPMAQYGYSKLLVHYASNEIAKLVIIPSGKLVLVLSTIIK